MRRIITGFLFVLLVAGCSEEFPENTLTFSTETIQVPDVNLPEKSHYAYSWHSFGKDSLPELHFAVDDTILQIFTLDGSRNTFYSLPNPERHPSFNVLNGPDGKIYYFKHPGNLYVQEGKQFRLYLKAMDLKRLEKDGLDIHVNYDCGNYARIYKDSFLLIPVTPGKKPNLKYSDLFSLHPMFAKVHLRTQKVEYLNYVTPEHYLRHDHYVYHGVSSLLVKDRLLIQYPYRETVEVYSLRSNKVIAKYDMKSAWQDGEIKALSVKNMLDGKRKTRYMVESAHYGSLVYNPYKKQYYRIFYHPLGEKTANGEYTIDADKRCSIIVFDEHFRYLGEYVLPTKFHVLIGITPLKDGLIVNSSSRKATGGMTLMKITYKTVKRT